MLSWCSVALKTTDSNAWLYSNKNQITTVLLWQRYLVKNRNMAFSLLPYIFTAKLTEKSKN